MLNCNAQFNNGLFLEISNNNYKIIQIYFDIEISSKLLYRSNENSSINIRNAIAVSGYCEITNSSNATLDISYLEMCKNSLFKSSSRNINNNDYFYLNQNSTYNIRLDGQAQIRKCYLNDNSKISIYS